MTPSINIESLLEPVSEIEPAGPNLQYDLEFFELERAVKIAAAEETDSICEWRKVAQIAESLFRRTKDLRVAVALLRAMVAIKGWAGLRDGLALIEGLLDRYWVSMHPELDIEEDGDPTWRLNILATLGYPSGLIGELFSVPLVIASNGQIISLTDVNKAHKIGKQGVAKASLVEEIETAFRTADKSEVRRVLQAMLDASDYLMRIEAMLSMRTGRSIDERRAHLTDVLERAMCFMENGLKHSQILFNFAGEPLKSPIKLTFESPTDFDSEKITDLVPELKKLLQARKSLNEILTRHDEHPDADSSESVVLSDAPGDEIPELKAPSEAAPPPDDPKTVPSPAPLRANLPEDRDLPVYITPPRDEHLPKVDENVQFTVYRPRSVIAARWHTLLAFAHLAEPRDDAPPDEPDPDEEVHRQAMRIVGEDAGNYQALTDDSAQAIPEHSQLTFVPHVPGVEFNPTSRAFRWTEAVHRESFRMRADAALAGKRARGRLSVFLGSILIGEVSLSFRVDAAGQTSREREPIESSSARPYRKIFPSYAHADAAIVEQFERYAESLGDEYLRDVTTLRSGEVWDERLGELIAYADVFQLFWSTRSMVSVFVRSEWERALALNRPHFIRPVYWEDPLPQRPAEGLPPTELSRLHFQRIPWALPTEPPVRMEEPIYKAPPSERRAGERIKGDLEEKFRKAEHPSSVQHKLDRIRHPRVHITYDADFGDAMGEVQLPLIMGVLADLTGRPKDPVPEVLLRRHIEEVRLRISVEIDIDNFNDVMKALQPRVTFAVPNEFTGEGELRVDLTFESMDDFSPGSITSRILAADHLPELEDRLSAQINSILHHVEFQKMESAWRGLHFLVNNTETDERLRIRVFDISKADLAATLKKYKGAAWDQSPIFQTLYKEVYGQLRGTPYSCLVGDYYFDHSPPDVELLGEMGRISAALHAPFITGASPSVMQMDSWQELEAPKDLTKIFEAHEYHAWRFLRDSEDSRYIFLTLPRFLARLPYNPETNPVSEFDFAEDTEGADLSRYTWANSAYAMATNISRSFNNYGWCTQIRGIEMGGAVEGLPVYTFPMHDARLHVKRSTEVVVDDRRETELAKNGFMPLLDFWKRDISAFIGTSSLHKPALFEDVDATISASLMARLPYLLVCCTFAHYMKCMIRDRISSFNSLTDMQRFLNIWISKYVTGSTDTSEHVKARRPLAAAEVVLEEVKDTSDFVNAKLYLRPHFKIDVPEVTLSLTTELPLPKSLRSEM